MTNNPDIRIGDQVKFTAAGKVKSLDSFTVGLDSGAYVSLQDLRNGVLTHELVKRARPKVDAVLTPADLRAHQWKRGTLIRLRHTDDRYRMLHEDGKWHGNEHFTRPVPFDEIVNTYVLVYDPSAK